VLFARNSIRSAHVLLLSIHRPCTRHSAPRTCTRISCIVFALLILLLLCRANTRYAHHTRILFVALIYARMSIQE
jgi:hypothetical protein